MKENRVHRLSMRLSDVELITFNTMAWQAGQVDRNGKPKISSYIRDTALRNPIVKKQIKTNQKLFKGE